MVFDAYRLQMGKYCIYWFTSNGVYSFSGGLGFRLAFPRDLTQFKPHLNDQISKETWFIQSQRFFFHTIIKTEISYRFC